MHLRLMIPHQRPHDIYRVSQRQVQQQKRRGNHEPGSIIIRGVYEPCHSLCWSFRRSVFGGGSIIYRMDITPGRGEEAWGVVAMVSERVMGKLDGIIW